MGRQNRGSRDQPVGRRREFQGGTNEGFQTRANNNHSHHRGDGLSRGGPRGGSGSGGGGERRPFGQPQAPRRGAEPQKKDRRHDDRGPKHVKPALHRNDRGAMDRHGRDAQRVQKPQSTAFPSTSAAGGYKHRPQLQRVKGLHVPHVDSSSSEDDGEGHGGGNNNNNDGENISSLSGQSSYSKATATESESGSYRSSRSTRGQGHDYDDDDDDDDDEAWSFHSSDAGVTPIRVVEDPAMYTSPTPFDKPKKPKVPLPALDVLPASTVDVRSSGRLSKRQRLESGRYSGGGGGNISNPSDDEDEVENGGTGVNDSFATRPSSDFGFSPLGSSILGFDSHVGGPGGNDGRPCTPPPIAGSIQAMASTVSMRRVDTAALQLVQRISANQAQKHAMYKALYDVINLLESQGMKVYVYGSAKTGIMIPSSDIDLYIDADPRHGVVRGSGTPGKLRGADSRKGFDRVCNLLRKSQFFKNIKRIVHARVPVLKCTHGESGLQMDFSFIDDGLISSRFLNKCFDAWSDRGRHSGGGRFLSSITEAGDAEASGIGKHNCFIYARALAILIKYLLSTWNLDDPSVGGLGSYGVSLMVLFFLETVIAPSCTDAEVAPPVTNGISGDGRVGLGYLLIEFLRWYGETFDYKRYGINLLDRCVFGKPPTFSLHINNPLEPTRNAVSACSRFQQVRSKFSETYHSLNANPGCFSVIFKPMAAHALRRPPSAADEAQHARLVAGLSLFSTAVIGQLDQGRRSTHHHQERSSPTSSGRHSSGSHSQHQQEQQEASSPRGRMRPRTSQLAHQLTTPEPTPRQRDSLRENRLKRLRELL